MPDFLLKIADSTNRSIYFNQLSCAGTHDELKMRVSFRLGGDDLQASRLRDDGDERIAGLQAAEVADGSRTFIGLNSEGMDLGVGE